MKDYKKKMQKRTVLISGSEVNEDETDNLELEPSTSDVIALESSDHLLSFLDTSPTERESISNISFEEVETMENVDDDSFLELLASNDSTSSDVFGKH